MNQYVLLRIQSLQEELENLKELANDRENQNPRRITQIKGLWKDFEITDRDFEDAKKSIYQADDKWKD